MYVYQSVQRFFPHLPTGEFPSFHPSINFSVPFHSLFILMGRELDHANSSFFPPKHATAPCLTLERGIFLKRCRCPSLQCIIRQKVFKPLLLLRYLHSFSKSGEREDKRSLPPKTLLFFFAAARKNDLERRPIFASPPPPFSSGAGNFFEWIWTRRNNIDQTLQKAILFTSIFALSSGDFVRGWQDI